jgi:hypothetical protein
VVAELRQRTIDMDSRSITAGCLKDGKTTDPPAVRSASTKVWSDAASDAPSDWEPERMRQAPQEFVST